MNKHRTSPANLIAPPTVDLPVRGISSHRGANHSHPENTLAAFREALRMGVHQLEMDIYLTENGDLPVIHDPTADRTTNGHGEIMKMDALQIMTLDAGSWKGPEFAGERIPMLDQVLPIMPCNVWLNLQLKGGSELGAAVARRVIEHKLKGQAFLAAGQEAADGARSICRDILICNLDRDPDLNRYVDRTIARGDAFIQFTHRHGMPSREQIIRLKKAGIKINYFKASHPGQLAALFELGIDFPLVDELPRMMKQAIQLGICPVEPAYPGHVSPAGHEPGPGKNHR